VEPGIEIYYGDITKLKVDAIVNAANTSLLGGGGVDGSIHRVAGLRLLSECKILNGCSTGNAKLTMAYSLPAKYVIHTVGPIWQGGFQNEDSYLANCYHNSMKIAETNNISTIAFPCISTGAYGFPSDRAAKIAIKTVQDFLESHHSIQVVIFVCFRKEDYDTYLRLLGSS
jgi:O-acetyl-ADP-ribose deacetylase (regulator of RNase III)